MKKVLFTIIILMGTIALRAQVVTYNPYRYQQQQQQQVQAQIVRVTAYAMNSAGTGYVKTQLKIQVTDSHMGQQLKVVEQYVSNGYGGGQWQKVYASGGVEDCIQMFANNPLEAQFMKKVFLVNTYYYFDI